MLLYLKLGVAANTTQHKASFNNKSILSQAYYSYFYLPKRTFIVARELRLIIG